MPLFMPLCPKTLFERWSLLCLALAVGIACGTATSKVEAMERITAKNSFLLLAGKQKEGREKSQHKGGRKSSKGISHSSAAALAQKQFGGKVLKVTPEGAVYRVKLLQPSGRVKIVLIDAMSGALISQ